MPILAFFKAYTFFIFAQDLSERRHVHVVKNKNQRDQTAKFWIERNGIRVVEIFDSGGLSKKECAEVEKIIVRNVDALHDCIDAFARGQKFSILHLQ